MTIAPIKRSVRTKAAPQKAFQLFAGQMGAWWPRGLTLGPNPHADIVIEPKTGGRWFERDAAGLETRWGSVLVWDPPRRLVLAWQLDAQYRFDPELITEVELIFAPTEEGGTEVFLEHRNLERLGKDTGRQAAQIGDGWSRMLREFAAHADSAATADL